MSIDPLNDLCCIVEIEYIDISWYIVQCGIYGVIDRYRFTAREITLIDLISKDCDTGQGKCLKPLNKQDIKLIDHRYDII